jgi:pyruvate/2-oxoglutarate/acetoin dehydrogenase E1 component
VRWAREAAAEVQGEGIEAEILDLRTVHPFDREAVARTVARTSRAVIVHEANRTLGIGAEVAAFLAEELFESLDAPLRRVAARDCHVPYAVAQEGAIIPGVADVAAALREVAAY